MLCGNVEEQRIIMLRFVDSLDQSLPIATYYNLILGRIPPSFKKPEYLTEGPIDKLIEVTYKLLPFVRNNLYSNTEWIPQLTKLYTLSKLYRTDNRVSYYGYDIDAKSEVKNIKYVEIQNKMHKDPRATLPFDFKLQSRFFDSQHKSRADHSFPNLNETNAQEISKEHEPTAPKQQELVEHPYLHNIANSILVPDIEDTAKHVENLEKENDDVEKLTYTQPQKTSLIKRKFGNNYLKPVNPVHLPDDDTSKMVGSTSKIYETCSAQTKRAERREVHISHILVAAKNLNRYSKVKFIRLTCNDLHIADGMDETEVTGHRVN
ncbi:hypothetical protein GJ496_004656 [Pomphorhynchus laevis]|nr:hypothetical protein GJ496_004656 [Pomphorhynchus laevis]